MNELATRPTGQLARPQRTAASDWPQEAIAFAEELSAHYPADDPYPGIVGAWIARQKRTNTRQTYVRQFRTWDTYCRDTNNHPLAARFTLAEAFSRYLENAPTLRPVKGGHRGERALTGPPLADTSRANLLSACSSFHAYAVRVRNDGIDPFALVNRPDIDPDYSPTKGSKESDTAKLLDAAYGDGPRTYALFSVLYTMAMRLEMALSARAENLGYDEGHRVLTVITKGGRKVTKTVPPSTGHAIDILLAGRTDELIFQTRTGKPMDKKNVWKLLRRIAAQAGVSNASTIHPHVLKHDAITHALRAPDAKLHHVQDFADHKDPRTTRRYDRRRGAHDSSPAYGVAARMTERRSSEGD